MSQNPTARRAAKKTTTAAVAPVYHITDLPAIDVTTKFSGRLTKMSEGEAREITTQIQRTMNRLWLLVTEAHDRRAHEALGYKTWADYCRAELGMSESRSYQFLDTGHVMKALAAGGADISTVPVPPTRVVARVKDHLGDVQKAAQAALEAPEGDPGKAVDKAIRALAREPQLAPARSRGGSSSAATTSNGTRTPDAATEEQVACPACAGTGRVTKSVADRLLDLLKSLK